MLRTKHKVHNSVSIMINISKLHKYLQFIAFTGNKAKTNIISFRIMIICISIWYGTFRNIAPVAYHFHRAIESGFLYNDFDLNDQEMVRYLVHLFILILVVN